MVLTPFPPFEYRKLPNRPMPKKRRKSGVAQSCSAFWNYSAASIFSQHPQESITNLRTDTPPLTRVLPSTGGTRQYLFKNKELRRETAMLTNAMF
jgi:hypothetical protein